MLLFFKERSKELIGEKKKAKELIGEKKKAKELIGEEKKAKELIREESNIREKEKMKNRNKTVGLLLALALGFMIFSFARVQAADPVGPDAIDLISNVTKNATVTKMINISGGRIGTFNVNATIQNPRWKAFIGNVTGKFTLMDGDGYKVFDWTISSITGRIYATDNSTTLSWSTINCSNITHLENENVRMNHTRADDNITKTFNATFDGSHTISGGHAAFYVGSRYMPANTCPTLNTYENSASQDTDFEEVALSDGSNMVYAAILEDNQAGYNNYKYDFQMIVPEIGLSGFSGATAYYIYVEIGT